MHTAIWPPTPRILSLIHIFIMTREMTIDEGIEEMEARAAEYITE